eukprot:TRINITY_DN14_c0_g1_i3.p1 TRINITY_DN14_c0_g1~~TRINITY_DN14_c0_g1_i3.p1  ORF type:complete len:272 (-),score=56.96 TRINITY_DN14_c0_g1_i3:21-836(-)
MGEAPVRDQNNLKEFWDEFAEEFDLFSESTNQIIYCLAVNSKISTATDPILEVGCGTGRGTELIMFMKQSSVELQSIDLSPNMVKITRSRLDGVLDSSCINESSSQELDFEDEYFGRYISNMVLHLTPDPLKMVSEAFRVLKTGGIAAFSVWGRMENSPQFVLSGQVNARLEENESNQNYRSPFHLCNKETTRELLLSVGFTKVFAWYMKTTTELDLETFSQKMLLRNKKIIAQNPEKEQLYLDGYNDVFQPILDEGDTIHYESLLLIAIK